MKSSPTRVAAVTGGLMVAGALFGTIAAVIGAAVAVTLTDGPGAALTWPILGMAAIVGGVLGAPLLPATSWLLLRRVPLGLSWLGTSVGTVIGGVIGWVAAVMLGGNPVAWPVLAALAGFFAAVVFLKLRFSAPRERIHVPGGAGA